MGDDHFRPTTVCRSASKLRVSVPRSRSVTLELSAVLEQPDAHGKHLSLHTTRDLSLHVHLGMRGKWLRFPDPSVPPLPRVRLRLATGNGV